jgi:hypothetical protein
MVPRSARYTQQQRSGPNDRRPRRKSRGEDSDTDEDEALVGLGAALHAAEQLVHQIQRRHVLQVRSHRQRRRNGKSSNSRALGAGALRSRCVPASFASGGFCWAFRFLFTSGFGFKNEIKIIIYSLCILIIIVIYF